MKILKSLFVTLILGTATAITSYTTEPTITQQKQVAGYYHHQIGDEQITTLFNNINYISISLVNIT